MAERGFVQIGPLLSLARDPGFSAVRRHPDFEAALSEIAGRWLERAKRREDPNQAELLSMARAHALRGEQALAREALERAFEHGGPYDDAIERELAASVVRVERSRAPQPRDRGEDAYPGKEGGEVQGGVEARRSSDVAKSGHVPGGDRSRSASLGRPP